MANPGLALLNWWKTASTRSRWYAGILLFSVASTAALVAITTAPSGGSSAGSPAGTDLSFWYFAGAFLKLIFVIALIVGGANIYRHYAHKPLSRGPARRLEIVETVRLSPRQSLHLVRAGGRCLLVGATDQALSLITELDAEAPASLAADQVEAPAAATAAAGLSPAPAAQSELSFKQVFAALTSTRLR